MKSFVSLLFGPGDPGAQQRWAEAEFPSRLAGSRFRHWSPSTPPPADRDRILLGVAVWSRYDLELLDRLEVTLTRHKQLPAIYVFDIDQIESIGPEAFEPYVPGIGKVYHTPIVGIWQNSVLTARAFGHKGRELLAETSLLESFCLSDAEQIAGREPR